MSLYLADTAPLLLPDAGQITLTPLHEQVLEALSGGGALFFATSPTGSTLPAEVCGRTPGAPAPGGVRAGAAGTARDRPGSPTGSW